MKAADRLVYEAKRAKYSFHYTKRERLLRSVDEYNAKLNRMLDICDRVPKASGCIRAAVYRQGEEALQRPTPLLEACRACL